MEAFCRRCGSILLRGGPEGAMSTRCPRCGPSESPAHTPEGSSRPAHPPLFNVRKGVSPRSSTYAKRSLEDASMSEEGLAEALISPKEPAKGAGAPAGRMFPFDTVRPGQKEFMEDVRDVVRSGKVLLASVPTGIGKTAAALSAALEHSLENGLYVMFLTSKQSQHSIAVQTLRLLKKRSGRDIKAVDMISKQAMCPRELSKLPHSSFNFACKQQSKDGTCPLFKPPPPSLVQTLLGNIHDVSQTVDLCRERRVCPHRAALETARQADVLICDFNYAFSDLSDKVLSSLDRKLDGTILIVDESHNLPDRIRAQRSRDLPVRVLDDAMVSVSQRHIKHYLSALKELVLKKAGSMKEGEREMELGKREFVSEVRGLFEETLGGGFDADAFADMLRETSQRKGLPEEEDPLIAVSEFLEGLLTLKESHLLFLSIPEGRSIDSLRLSYKDLDPSDISGPVIKACSSAVLMSGTLTPPSMFGDILGIARSRRIEREYPSPFPRNNRLVLLDDSVTTVYSSRGEAMYRTIAERIASLAGRFPGNVAAFFPSYSFMSEVHKLMWGCPKKVVIEERQMGKAEKEGVLEDLRRSKQKGGSLLLAVMGGSLSEGVDYRDNLLSGVLVVGLPLAPPTLEVMAVRDLARRKFGPVKGDEYSYDHPAVNKVLQAAGRPIRSESDRSVVVLMEARFNKGRYLKFIPLEMRPLRPGGVTLEQAVDRFFDGAPTTPGSSPRAP